MRYSAAVLALSLLASAAQARPAAVFVPGTLNSIVPGGSADGPQGEELKSHPYCSQAIIDAVAREGYETFVVPDLDPLGTLEGNGRKAAIEGRQRALYSAAVRR